MSDRFYRVPIDHLFQWITGELSRGDSIFGIPRQLFYHPSLTDRFRIRRFGELLETPIGVAAGPHTQMAQNIVAAWLSGARYIELKTIQVLDRIEVTKPCIDMADEGYNCEWSQELGLAESFNEYLKAWILIHLLRRILGFSGEERGFIFNMSVGYSMEGILSPTVQTFMERMGNCREPLQAELETLSRVCPDAVSLVVPERISDNVTLSTMHGCPPGEIERIGLYLIGKQRLHTTIKLNPTLLGREELRAVLNRQLGWEVDVPDEAFAHDIKYDAAVSLIRSLRDAAVSAGIHFGLKLTNTLEVRNTRGILPVKEPMIYLSGRALHPLSILVARKLQRDFNGELDLSFSAGADCFNISEILACNIRPVTVCTDLLKPGGYSRLPQYLEEIDQSIRQSGATTVEEFIRRRWSMRQNTPIGPDTNSVSRAGLANLEHYADTIHEKRAYHKESFPYESIKTARPLDRFDCVAAPCATTCPVHQNVPDYMEATARGDFERAFECILVDNPLPNVTGMVCDHLCQTKCTRINLDSPLQIREIKRFNAARPSGFRFISSRPHHGSKVAIIGAGPSGLTAAHFLTNAGFDVTIYEHKNQAGGMVSDAIPPFRLDERLMRRDIEAILQQGAKTRFNTPVDTALFEKIRRESAFVYIAVGAQRSKKLRLPGEDARGIADQLAFLSAIRRNQYVDLGKKVVVIGGGNSCMDAARTAHRLVGPDGEVVVIYRRTRKEMPADRHEVDSLLAEGISLLELTAPESLTVVDGRIVGVVCSRMELGQVDESGRPRPIKIEKSEFEIHADSVISALGQEVVVDFLPGGRLNVDSETLETTIPNVFAGGDAIRGPSTLIRAIGDGKRVAQTIIRKVLQDESFPRGRADVGPPPLELHLKLSRRQALVNMSLESPLAEDRELFGLVHPLLDELAVRAEAARCLSCHRLCNVCVSVCPNRANVSYLVQPIDLMVPRIFNESGRLRVEEAERWSVRQQPQIINIHDFCNECGNCAGFCPTAGAPYLVKPRFALTQMSFDAEEECYFFQDGALKAKSDGHMAILRQESGESIYESDALVARLDAATFRVIQVSMKDDSWSEVNLHQAAEMFVLFRSLHDHPMFQKNGD